MSILFFTYQTDLDAFAASNVQLYGVIPSDTKVPEGEYLVDYTGQAGVEYETTNMFGNPTTSLQRFSQIYLKPIDGFKINSASVTYKEINGVGMPVTSEHILTISDGGMKADINVSLGTGQTDRVWQLDVSENITIIDFYKFTQTDFENFDSYGINAFLNSLPLEIGDVLNGGDVLSLEIDLSNKYVFSDNELYFQYITAESKIAKVFFDVSEARKTATLALTIPDNFLISDILNLGLIIYDVSGANHIYVVNDEILKEVSSQRYTWEGDSDFKDWGEFILSVKNYPFKIPTELIEPPSKIKLASNELNSEANTLLNENLTINVGSIYVEPINNNVLDYKNAKCILHLPFIEPVELNPEYVIGETISITFKVNVNSGELLTLVSSETYGGVFAQFSSKIGFDVPYLGNPYRSGNSVFDIAADVYNNNRQCYVELVTYENPLEGDFFNVPIKDYGILSNCVGYVEVENIDLKSRCYGTEKQELVNLLRAGVIIN